MCSRGSSQIIKIALVMLISGILLSGKGPKTYQLGLCFFFLPLKGTTSILTHFRSTSPSPGQRPAAKNKHLLPPPPASEKKSDLPPSPPTSNVPSLR